MTATDTSPVSVASYFVICTSSDAYAGITPTSYKTTFETQIIRHNLKYHQVVPNIVLSMTCETLPFFSALSIRSRRARLLASAAARLRSTDLLCAFRTASATGMPVAWYLNPRPSATPFQGDFAAFGSGSLRPRPAHPVGKPTTGCRRSLCCRY